MAHQRSDQGFPSSAPIDRLLLPFRTFARRQASGGILLCISTVVALVWANSRWEDSYRAVWEINFVLQLGNFVLSESLHHWINDGLMAMFFFVVGLELKREVLVGELASPRHAALPVAAALGGMIVPALLYSVLNFGKATAHGWGVPMATDIAFALGVLTLLGERVPVALKVFLTALAIADDLGAVLVIALFYTSDISVLSLIVGGMFLLILVLANLSGVTSPLVYALLGIGGLWVAFLFSGIHATLAGVLGALTIPARSKINSNEFLGKAKQILHRFERPDELGKKVLIGGRRLAALLHLRLTYEEATSPLQRLEHALHPWVVFLVLPVFALANAGVQLEARVVDVLSDPVTLGIILGLVAGKQIGITLFTWLAVRLGLASLPPQITWSQIYGASWLGGIGFTMSLFIATLAFEDPSLLTAAKLGILIASVIAGCGGWFILHLALRREEG